MTARHGGDDPVTGDGDRTFTFRICPKQLKEKQHVTVIVVILVIIRWSSGCTSTQNLEVLALKLAELQLFEKVCKFVI